VVRALPFTSITVAATNPVPVTAIVKEVAPTVSVEGEVLVIVGAKFGAVTVTVAAVDVPPPGAGFTAVNERLPAAATSAAVNDTLTCVSLEYVVVRALPFTLIIVVGTNPVPVTVIVGVLAPVISLVCDSDVRVGAGLFTVKFTGVPDPLLTDPFMTATASCPPLTICPDGITAVNRVAFTNVVVSLCPFTWTIDVLRKFVPFTVSVTEPDPALTHVGVIEVIVGVAVVPPPLPEFDPPPPQPVRTSDTPRPTNRAKHPTDFIDGSSIRTIHESDYSYLNSLIKL
jgi:hypothetical protein